MNKLFSSNIAVRIVSVLIALVIWVVASDQSISQSTSQEMSKNFYRIPIEAINIPNNYSVNYDYISIESVVLKGNASLLSSMLGQEITASIDLEGLTEGEFDLPIQLRFPAGLSLVAVQPPRVHVTLVSSVSRVMYIEIITVGTPQITNVKSVLSYKPETVLVAGPRTSLEEIVKAVVQVDLTGKTGNFEQAMDVQVLDANGIPVEDVGMQPSLISVTVLFQPSKQIPLQLSETLVLPEGWSIDSFEINPSTVKIYGSQSDLDLIENLSVALDEIVLTKEEALEDQVEKTFKTSVGIPQGSLITIDTEQEVEIVLRLVKGNPG